LPENSIERNDAEDFSATVQCGVVAHFSRQENTGDYEVKYENVPVGLREYLHDATIGRTQLALSNHMIEQFNARSIESINEIVAPETTRKELIESATQDIANAVEEAGWRIR
jgi:hypothetical protein